MRLRCPGCDNTTELDLAAVHEPDRVCHACKSPWVPHDYRGTLLVREQTVTPLMAWRWLTDIGDGSGHWTLSPPTRAKRHAEMMRSGTWEPSRLGQPNAVAQAVTFDCWGNMLAGVVRCLACVEADCSFDTVLRHFTPTVDGHVPFDWGFQQRKVPPLLSYWHWLRDNRAPVAV